MPEAITKLSTYRCYMQDCNAILFEGIIPPGGTIKKVCKCGVTNIISVPAHEQGKPAGQNGMNGIPYQERLKLSKKSK